MNATREDYKSAERYLRRAVELGHRVSGVSLETMALSTSVYGATLWKEPKYAEAEPEQRGRLGDFDLVHLALHFYQNLAGAYQDERHGQIGQPVSKLLALHEASNWLREYRDARLRTAGRCSASPEMSPAGGKSPPGVSGGLVSPSGQQPQ
jgi:hypothetical protein